MKNTKCITTKQALPKLQHYCAYQERCESEVKAKLDALGVRKEEQYAVIAHLIDAEYLNEERFAAAFAQGKFATKEWGRRKISAELMLRRVNNQLIRKALDHIDAEQYKATLRRLARDKYESLAGSSLLIRKKKTIDYLLQKGYEPELVYEALQAT